MTRTARKSVNVRADPAIVKTVSRQLEIQFFLVDVVRKMYFFLLDTAWERGSYFENFPNDCCYYSTFFAALVLERLGFERVLWIFGYRESTGAHVWFNYKNFEIDLTAGQYSDYTSTYIFNDKTASQDGFTSSFRVFDHGFFDDRFRQSKVYFDLQPIVDDFISRTNQETTII